MAADREKLDKTHELEGSRAGLEMVKHREQLSHQQQLAEIQARNTARQQTNKPKSKGD
jgi:hypothetical protein